MSGGEDVILRKRRRDDLTQRSRDLFNSYPVGDGAPASEDLVSVEGGLLI